MPHRAVVWKSLTEPTIIASKGGAGSGNFGHTGRPGHRGGSAGGGSVGGGKGDVKGGDAISGARRVETKEDIQKFLGGAGVNPDLEEREEAFLDEYKQEGYLYVNDDMRSGYEGETEEQIWSIQDSIGFSEGVSESVVVYRGMHEDVFAGGGGVPKDLTGIEFSDKAFVSTSLDASVGGEFAARAGERGIVMEIVLPKGTKALNMERWGAGTESELLLQRDLKFKIVGDNRASGRDAGGMGTIQVEIVP